MLILSMEKGQLAGHIPCGRTLWVKRSVTLFEGIARQKVAFQRGMSFSASCAVKNLIFSSDVRFVVP